MQKRHTLYLLVAAFLAVNAVVWGAVLKTHEEPRLTVSFLDVGQGDAILIEGPTGIQMLIDGGRDRAVLRELPKAMGFLDRSLDVVVETHPDADHIGGLPSVFERYAVGRFLEPGIPNDTNATFALIDAVQKEPGIETAIARSGQRILLGGGAYADILFPDRDVSTYETNTGSIVMRVVYGDTSFMLTGDAPSEIEDYLVGRDGAKLQVTVLKAGHHGSRNSTDALWLKTLAPDLVVISAGKDNAYGHPHTETLERIRAQGAEIVGTAEEGTLTFISDGEAVTRK